jgi:hypothetical protein
MDARERKILDKIKEFETPEAQDQIIQEDLMYQLVEGPAWRHLKEIFEAYIATIDQKLEVTVGDDLETVGIKYVVASTVKTYLLSIIANVEAAHSAMKDSYDKKD